MDDSDKIAQMEDSTIPTLQTDLTNKVRKFFNVSITQGLTTASVNFAAAEPDIQYMIIGVFSWFTNYRLTAKTVNGFTVEFSVAAPVNAKLDYVILR